MAEFKSGREMARYFQIDGKVARTAIAKGEYQDFLLVFKYVSDPEKQFTYLIVIIKNF